MAFSNAGAVLRADLNTVVLEALAEESLMIGTKVFPPFEVGEKSGQYPKFDIPEAQILRNIATERAQNGSYNEVVRSYKEETYSTVDRGLEERIDDTYRQDVARFFDAEQIAARFTFGNILIGHEKRVADSLFSATNFSATSAATAYTGANLATADFVEDVQKQIDDLRQNGVAGPLALVMSQTVGNYIKRTTRFQNFVKPYGVGGAIPTQSSIQAAFGDLGVTSIYFGQAGIDASKTRSAKSVSSIWNNDFVWVGQVTGGDPIAGGAGRTFVWNAEGGLFVTETYRDDSRRSDMVRVRQNTDEKVVNPNAGRLVQTSFA